MTTLRQILLGAAAGAAGTTALNVVTWCDVAWRGRPVSQTPQQTVQRLADVLRVGVPGSPQQQERRLDALGALGGLVTGTTMGVVHGVVQERLRLGPTGSAALATAIALVGANGPMTVLGVTDPRTWSRADWLADVVPHVAFGVVTAAALRASSRPAISGLVAADGPVRRAISLLMA